MQMDATGHDNPRNLSLLLDWPQKRCAVKVRYLAVHIDLAVEPSLVSLAARLRSSISTVAVMPAASTTPVGTSSICTRTGMRCARRTQVKMGLTFATP